MSRTYIKIKQGNTKRSLTKRKPSSIRFTKPIAAFEDRLHGADLTGFIWNGVKHR